MPVYVVITLTRPSTGSTMEVLDILYSPDEMTILERLYNETLKMGPSWNGSILVVDHDVFYGLLSSH